MLHRSAPTFRLTQAVRPSPLVGAYGLRPPSRKNETRAGWSLNKDVFFADLDNREAKMAYVEHLEDAHDTVLAMRGLTGDFSGLLARHTLHRTRPRWLPPPSRRRRP